MATNVTTADAEKHIVYEIKMMCDAAARYAQEHGAGSGLATPSDPDDAIFFLEASLMHARALIMAFGFPGGSEAKVVRALGAAEDFNKQFAAGFSLPGGTTCKTAYNQLSEVIGHVGPTRWSPATVAVHQPVNVATAVLDGLVACGVTGSNTAVGAAVQSAYQTLTDAA